jgi:PhnB protein
MDPQIALGFNGDCEEAFACYARALGGTLAFMMRWADKPNDDQAPPEWKNKVYHATLDFGRTKMAGSDVLPDQYERPKGFSLILNLDDVSRAEAIFHALAGNGTVQVPLQETFWAARFGCLVDRFGIPWTINCEGERVTS